MTAEVYATIRDEELAGSRRPCPASAGPMPPRSLDDLVLSDDFAEFLTLEAYPRLG